MDWMTIEQAAEYLQVSRETLYKYAQSGKVPASKVGRHWRFSRTAIDAWIAGTTTVQTGEDSPAPPPLPSDAADRVATAPPIVSPVSRSGSAASRILVVDDEALLLRFLGSCLKQLGHEVSLAANGLEALDLIATQTFDILFVDLHLPDMNGTDVIAKLPENPRPAVVIITGYPDSTLMNEALSQPITYALSKPFKRSDIEAVIRMIRPNLA